jgi:hypothetical protein
MATWFDIRDPNRVTCASTASAGSGQQACLLLLENVSLGDEVLDGRVGFE